MTSPPPISSSSSNIHVDDLNEFPALSKSTPPLRRCITEPTRWNTLFPSKSSQQTIFSATAITSTKCSSPLQNTDDTEMSHEEEYSSPAVSPMEYNESSQQVECQQVSREQDNALESPTGAGSMSTMSVDTTETRGTMDGETQWDSPTIGTMMESISSIDENEAPLRLTPVEIPTRQHKFSSAFEIPGLRPCTPPNPLTFNTISSPDGENHHNTPSFIQGPIQLRQVIATDPHRIIHAIKQMMRNIIALEKMTMVFPRHEVEKRQRARMKMLADIERYLEEFQNAKLRAETGRAEAASSVEKDKYATKFNPSAPSFFPFQQQYNNILQDVGLDLNRNNISSSLPPPRRISSLNSQPNIDKEIAPSIQPPIFPPRWMTTPHSSNVKPYISPPYMMIPPRASAFPMPTNFFKHTPLDLLPSLPIHRNPSSQSSHTNHIHPQTNFRPYPLHLHVQTSFCFHEPQNQHHHQHHHSFRRPSPSTTPSSPRKPFFPQPKPHSCSISPHPRRHPLNSNLAPSSQSNPPLSPFPFPPPITHPNQIISFVHQVPKKYRHICPSSLSSPFPSTPLSTSISECPVTNCLLTPLCTSPHPPATSTPSSDYCAAIHNLQRSCFLHTTAAEIPADGCAGWHPWDGDGNAQGGKEAKTQKQNVKEEWKWRVAMDRLRAVHERGWYGVRGGVTAEGEKGRGAGKGGKGQSTRRGGPGDKVTVREGRGEEKKREEGRSAEEKKMDKDNRAEEPSTAAGVGVGDRNRDRGREADKRKKGNGIGGGRMRMMGGD